MKKPVTYKDWRGLYYSVAKELGWSIFYRWSDNRSLLTKRIWTLLHRLERIWQRLQVENKVMDSLWCEAMFEHLNVGTE